MHCNALTCLSTRHDYCSDEQTHEELRERIRLCSHCVSTSSSSYLHVAKHTEMLMRLHFVNTSWQKTTAPYRASHAARTPYPVA